MMTCFKKYELINVKIKVSVVALRVIAKKRDWKINSFCIHHTKGNLRCKF